jgi:hypothetical protein
MAPSSWNTAADTDSAHGYRATTTGVDQGIIPLGVEAARDWSVEAVIRRNGRASRIAVRYEATLDGRRVTVEQSLGWGRVSEPLAPAWVED